MESRLKSAENLAKDIGSRQSTVLSNLRSVPNLCHTFECWRSGRRVGNLMFRQGDAQVFKKYSQMKLQMKREALEKMNRQASEM
jgi:hypothetical protein